jgi:hypothetical protein
MVAWRTRTVELETRLPMTAGHRNFLAMAAACALLVSTTGTAKAQFVTRTQADWIVVGIAAIGAGTGIGVFYAFHHGHSINGCTLSGPNGLELQNRGDQQTYALTGEVADIKPGDRVRVSGKKEKKKPGAPQQFLVEKLSKVFGSCEAQPATPAISSTSSVSSARSSLSPSVP